MRSSERDDPTDEHPRTLITPATRPNRRNMRRPGLPLVGLVRAVVPLQELRKPLYQ